MPLTDLPYDQLPSFRADVPESPGFDAFWEETLALARSTATAPHLTAVREELLSAVEAYDVRFPGWRGQPVAAWLMLPAGSEGSLPTVVTYLGYGCGRGFPTDHLLFAAAGYAHLVVDSRGHYGDHGGGHGAAPRVQLAWLRDRGLSAKGS